MSAILKLLISICFLFGLSKSLSSLDVDEAIERDKMRLPEFYNTRYKRECQVDSPELYFQTVALPTLQQLIQEGKTFFGVLLDHLDEALNEDETYDKLRKDWEYLTDVLLASFEDREESITWLWKKFSTIVDTVPLPWEIWPKKTVLIEIIGAIHYDYLVLEAAIRMAVKEIVMSSLKEPFKRIMVELDQEMTEKYGEGAPTGEELIERMVEILKEIQPNFVGRLLAGMLGRAKAKTTSSGRADPQQYLSFLHEPIEQIGILVVAFRSVSEEYSSNFWKDMTSIMKESVPGTNITAKHLFMIYSTNGERVIKNVMYMLTPKDEI